MKRAHLADTADMLDRLAKRLRQGEAIDAWKLAAEWSGTVRANAANPGSRSSVPARERDLGTVILTTDAYTKAHDRMTANLQRLRTAVEALTADLERCRRASRTTRPQANNLDRINSRAGECEACYTAGRDDSYQDGRDRKLEAVTIRTISTTDVSEVTHESFDLCRKCAKSARGSRASAASKGETWNPDEWMAQRITHLRSETEATR